MTRNEELHRKNSRAYYHANRDTILEKNRARLTEKKEQYNAARRTKRAADPESARQKDRVRVRDPIERAAYNAAYHADHRDEQLARNAEWRRVNAEQHRDNAKRWAEANPDRVKANITAWRVANPGYARKRYATDPEFALTCRLRARLAKVLKRAGARASASTMELVGCSGAALRAHIEAQFVAGMSWTNQGEWHIDHIKSCAIFDLADPQQQAVCFHYTNLRPLWIADNLARPRPRRS